MAAVLPLSLLEAVAVLPCFLLVALAEATTWFLTAHSSEAQEEHFHEDAVAEAASSVGAEAPSLMPLQLDLVEVLSEVLAPMDEHNAMLEVLLAVEPLLRLLLELIWNLFQEP